MLSNIHENIDYVIEKKYKLTLKNIKNKTYKQISKKFNV